MTIGINIDKFLFDNIKEFMIMKGSSVLKREVKDINGTNLQEMFGCTLEEETSFWKSNILPVIISKKINSSFVNCINNLSKKGNKIILFSSIVDDNNKSKLRGFIKTIFIEYLKANKLNYDEIVFSTDDKNEIRKISDIDIYVDTSFDKTKDDTKNIKFLIKNEDIKKSENVFIIRDFSDIVYYVDTFRKYYKGEKMASTGYPSIDKPWLKYYKKRKIEGEYPKMNMYEYMYSCNKYNQKNSAINYYGNRITYEKLFLEIESTKNSLLKLGIKKGDVVSIASPFLPEVVYLIYALNKIGAVANMVDPRVPADKFKNYLINSGSNYLFVIDKALPKIEKIKDEVSLNSIVSLSPADSLPMGIKFLKKTEDILNKKEYDFDNLMLWKDFRKLEGDAILNDDNGKYTPNQPAIIVYTSGTSGEPKGAISSNEAFNNMAFFQTDTVINTNRGDKFLLIMPPFIAYGLSIGMHGMLCTGQELIMVPTFNIDNSAKMLGNLVKKHKPQTVMGVPTFMVDLIEHPKMQNLDCSFLKSLIVGGDAMVPSSEERVNNFLRAKQSESRIYKGWGLTEVNSCFSYTRDDESNLIGSVGVPLFGNNIKVVKPIENEECIDIDNLEELPYGEVGEIFITSPTVIIDYLNNIEESNRVFFQSKKDGKVWVRTKDLGKINEDGLIRIEGRMKRIIIRPDGHNISPFAIENIINSNDKVEISAVIGRKSAEHEHGSFAVAYVQLKSEFIGKETEIEEELRKIISNKLPPRDVASYFEFIETLPLTNIGKVDYKELEKKDQSVKRLKKEKN